ncbi:acetoacetate--CoA ligase [Chromatocurvus halotolerans]|uniref:Acetoacetyl-CoA synthetase n=1 Tax=Chromatocurvus halotolerans TaxID=1132028 RepID=A0A4R2KW32_9GAMM|nr:acetoacetate--CoA ligase [Chromatocurvus halotolerans]TCO75436.1 acetoacetyl-CoA synthetase [Chromatocurvus halotolerans]
MNKKLWTPDAKRIAEAPITAFMQAVEREHGVAFNGEYRQLHRWSVEQPAAFWQAVWDFAGVEASSRGDAVLENPDALPGARWFPGAELNFAANLLRYRGEQTALVSLLENGERRTWSRDALYREVARVAAGLRDAGVQPGDRVAGFLPNIAETVVAMLATASLGAVWSSCSPDFGINGVLDRFGQIEPRVLFAADAYYYNGKTCDCLERVQAVCREVPSIETVVIVPLVGDRDISRAHPDAIDFAAFGDAQASDIDFASLPFDHPLYIMYSSGTTGVPKCIVHGAGGTLLQHLKEHRLQVGLGEGDVFFYYTTCGWMMWNWLVSGLACGATLLLYDGSPFARDGHLLLDAIDREGINVFGTSAKYIAALEKAGHRPRESHRLDSLRSVLSTGSPLSHESFDYVYREFRQELCLSSISGGTDILSCFVGGCPILPVYSGEIQAAGLGMAVEVWDDSGRPVVGEKGELVCTRPFPSCPLGFWNDDDGSRFHDAYFATWPGVWAHGDYAEVFAHGGFVIHGRSDAVLNPGGVRIGTAEIYRQVERIDEVLESVVIGQDWQDDVRVVLFVVLREGVVLDEALVDRIRRTIRENTTPRHVPARVLQVADIPRTISGKIVELAVRNVVHGRPVKNTDALANPEALSLFANRPELQD